MEAAKIQPESESIAVLQLQREMDEELRHWFLGQVLKRIRKFCEEQPIADANPIILSREVERDFSNDRDHKFLILLAVRELKVIGHLLAERVDFYGIPYILITQFNLDERMTFEQEQVGFKIISNWREEVGAKGIRATAVTPGLIMWYRRFGFMRNATVMDWRPNGRR